MTTLTQWRNWMIRSPATAPPVSDETDQSVAMATPSPAGDGGDVNNVLNGMFDLFEDKPVVTAQRAGEEAAAASSGSCRRPTCKSDNRRQEEESVQTDFRRHRRIFGATVSGGKAEEEKKEDFLESIF